MQTRHIEVLGHQIEYDAGNILLDEGSEELLSTLIADTIEIREELSGKEELYLEIEGYEGIQDVPVTWKVVNPWKEVAEELYKALNRIQVRDNHGDRIAAKACKKYEQLCKEEH